MVRIPLRGVRSSWLMLARNSFLQPRGAGQLGGSFSHPPLQAGVQGADVLLGLLSPGDIAADAENQLASVAQSPVATDFHIQKGPVFSAVAGLEVTARLVRAPDDPKQFLTCPLNVPIPDMKLADFLGSVAQHLAKTLVRLEHQAIFVQYHDPVSGLLDQDSPADCF